MSLCFCSLIGDIILFQRYHKYSEFQILNGKPYSSHFATVFKEINDKGGSEILVQT